MIVNCRWLSLVCQSCRSACRLAAGERMSALLVLAFWEQGLTESTLDTMLEHMTRQRPFNPTQASEVFPAPQGITKSATRPGDLLTPRDWLETHRVLTGAGIAVGRCRCIYELRWISDCGTYSITSLRLDVHHCSTARHNAMST